MNDIKLDAEQIKIYNKLRVLSKRLEKSNLWPSFFYKPQGCGIYIWGPVGRGKTMLMNRFYGENNLHRKIRLNFSHFMKMVHEELFKLQGISNPLNHVAAKLARKYSLICLDELFLEDIADASMIGSLFGYLIEKHVYLVMTSNFHPDKLYKDGSRYEIIKSSLERMKGYFNILKLDDNIDYRLLKNRKVERLFFGDLTAQIERELIDNFKRYSYTAIEERDLLINGRKLKSLAHDKNIVWFDFAELCEKPKSSLDYIAIAKQYKVVILSSIPQLDCDHIKDDDQKIFYSNRTRRFIALIDEFYDQNVLLIAHFTCTLDELYLAKEFELPFRRALSRLKEMEMQSYGYLALENLQV